MEQAAQELEIRASASAPAEREWQPTAAEIEAIRQWDREIEARYAHLSPEPRPWVDLSPEEQDDELRSMARDDVSH